MDNSYVLKFVNSNDVRKHLQAINYQFSVPEYAYLIWQNKSLSVTQKHLEFQLLIGTTDSCLVKASNCREGWDLHQTIKDYVALENKLISIFLKPEANSFYVAELLELGDWHEGNCFFNNPDLAYEYAMKYADKNPITSFRISKHYSDNSTSCSCVIEALYNSEGETMKIDRWGAPPEVWTEDDSTIWCERFDDMWFDIPIPFKPGDIVCDCYDKTPFVITDTVPWYRKEHPPKKAGTTRLCNFDMCASGYSLEKDTFSVMYNWVSFYYLNLEYYTNDLGGDNRILIAYSLFKQRKLNGDTLSKVVQMITAESFARKFCHDIDWVIDEETEKRLGIDIYKEKLNE